MLPELEQSARDLLDRRNAQLIASTLSGFGSASGMIGRNTGNAPVVCSAAAGVAKVDTAVGAVAVSGVDVASAAGIVFASFDGGVYATVAIIAVGTTTGAGVPCAWTAL